MTDAMRPTEELFDREAEYDAMLAEGLRLTGEDKHYFIRGRLELLRDVLGEALPAGGAPRRLLDFGCGTGDSTAALARAFPDARVAGVDTSARAIAHAQREHGGPRVAFGAVADLAASGDVDLCFVNGVFHHIPPAARPRALAVIGGALRPGGLLALFENNPWNPGTRLVMRRIPFDREAETISPRAAVALLRAHGFVPTGPGRHLFFFPAALSALRVLEPALRRLPLGGQYLVLARSVPSRTDGAD